MPERALHSPVRRITLAILAALTMLAAPTLVPAQTFTKGPTVEDGFNGGTTHESMLAAGPTYLLHFTPKWVVFYNKAALPAYQSFYSLDTFFNGNGISGDPVAFYDTLHDRYLMFVMAGTDEVKLMISKAGLDPTQPANWWLYAFNAPGRDYVGLGVSEDKIALVWNTGGGAAATIRLLDRAKAYDHLYAEGEPQIVASFAGLAWTRVCRNLTSDAALHVVSQTGSAIVYQTITGPATAPTISNPISIAIPGDPAVGVVIPDQPDNYAFGTCEPRKLEHEYPPLPEIYMRNKRIALAWTNSNAYGDGSPAVKAVRCVRFRTDGGDGDDPELVDDFQIGRPGSHYAYPSAVEDARGTLFVGYDRFSPNEYASCYMIARSGGHQSPEFLVKSGVATYLGCVTNQQNCAGQNGRWGDYTSMIVDEFASGTNQTTARFAGGWASEPIFGTDNAIGAMVANYGTATISGKVLSDNAGVLTNRAGAPVLLQVAGVAVDSTTTDSNGDFSFGLLPAGSYTIHLAWPSPVCEVNDVGITLSDGQISSGHQLKAFLQPTPLITSLSTTTVHNLDPDFNLVVTGQNFKSWSSVLVDGRPKVATLDVGAGQFTVSVKHNDIARSGVHVVAVLTPAAAGNGADTTALVSLPSYLVSESCPLVVVPCPAGDAGHIVITAVVKNSTECGINAQNATATLTLTSSNLSMMIWGAVQPYPPFPQFLFTSNGAFDAGTGAKTFTFDISKISMCGFLTPSLTITSGTQYQNRSYPQIDVRSLDLDARGLGTVDQLDVETFGTLNTSDHCGDFIPNGAVGLPDLAYLSSHLGHTAHVRNVITPNGGEVYTRTSASHPPIPVTWDTGCNGQPCGSEARVTINLRDGGNTYPVVTNVPDNGIYYWSNYCQVPSSSNKKIEVIHTVGLPPGNLTFGSDQSDNPFTIEGACGGGGGGGCPYLDTWVAGSWQEENSVLGRSTTGEMLNDLYRLVRTPGTAADGKVKLRLREDEQERTRLASVALRTVDRDASQSSWVVDGRVVVGSRAPVARVRTAAGEDITKLVTDPNGPGYDAKPGTTLHVELWASEDDKLHTRNRGGIILSGGGKEPEGLQSGPVAQTDAMVLNGTGIKVEIPNGRGGWNPSALWYPRARNADLSSYSGRELRLVFLGPHHIQGLQWMRVDDDAPATSDTPAATAVHSKTGEVATMLTGTGQEVTLSPGENLEFTFRVAPVPEGKVRDFYFASRGVYTSLPAAEGTQLRDLPEKLELLPARPNPTGGAVQIAFALPTSAKVRLSVFDPMGRLVIRLAEGNREAGRHDLTWDLKDRSGRRVSAGIYFYRMEVGRWQQQRTLTVR
jgi:hypothetical protein